MAHKPFNLHKRPAKKSGRFIYYCQFYDEYGNRLNAKSTGCTSKAAAENWAHKQLREGLIFTHGNILFKDYAEDWWIWDRCEYIKRKLARGRSISWVYVDVMRSYLENHILLYFGSKKLNQITPKMVEDWLFFLRKKIGKTGKPLAAITVNHCLVTLRIMLGEAVRREYLKKNPVIGVEPLKENPRERNILSIEEVRKLFKDDTINRIWEDYLAHFTINLLAASTGLRIGECQALKIDKIHSEYISVNHNWTPKYGLQPPKRRSYRDVPVPRKTSRYLHELIHLSTYREPHDFIFWGLDRFTPIHHNTIYRKLYKALNNIGISSAEREKRNITFHSWRHFFNTHFRGRIHDSKLQRLTGHRTDDMTDHYTHFSIEDFRDVMEIQEEYFG